MGEVQKRNIPGFQADLGGLWGSQLLARQACHCSGMKAQLGDVVLEMWLSSSQRVLSGSPLLNSSVCCCLQKHLS